MTVFLNCHTIISQLDNRPQSCECWGVFLVRLRLGPRWDPPWAGHLNVPPVESRPLLCI